VQRCKRKKTRKNLVAKEHNSNSKSNSNSNSNTNNPESSNSENSNREQNNNKETNNTAADNTTYNNVDISLNPFDYFLGIVIKKLSGVDLDEIAYKISLDKESKKYAVAISEEKCRFKPTMEIEAPLDEETSTARINYLENILLLIRGIGLKSICAGLYAGRLDNETFSKFDNKIARILILKEGLIKVVSKFINMNKYYRKIIRCSLLQNIIHYNIFKFINDKINTYVILIDEIKNIKEYIEINSESLPRDILDNIESKNQDNNQGNNQSNLNNNRNTGILEKDLIKHIKAKKCKLNKIYNILINDFEIIIANFENMNKQAFDLKNKNKNTDEKRYRELVLSFWNANRDTCYKCSNSKDNQVDENIDLTQIGSEKNNIYYLLVNMKNKMTQWLNNWYQHSNEKDINQIGGITNDMKNMLISYNLLCSSVIIENIFNYRILQGKFTSEETIKILE
jgi:hypothetical protein